MPERDDDSNGPSQVFSSFEPSSSRSGPYGGSLLAPQYAGGFVQPVAGLALRTPAEQQHQQQSQQQQQQPPQQQTPLFQPPWSGGVNGVAGRGSSGTGPNGNSGAGGAGGVSEAQRQQQMYYAQQQILHFNQQQQLAQQNYPQQQGMTYFVPQAYSPQQLMQQQLLQQQMMLQHQFAAPISMQQLQQPSSQILHHGPQQHQQGQQSLQPQQPVPQHFLPKQSSSGLIGMVKPQASLPNVIPPITAATVVAAQPTNGGKRTSLSLSPSKQQPIKVSVNLLFFLFLFLKEKQGYRSWQVAWCAWSSVQRGQVDSK
jgi:hypothetical protein